MISPSSPTARIPIPPPLLFAICLALGWVADWLLPLKVTHVFWSLRMLTGTLLSIASGLIAISAMWVFRRNQTTMDPNKSAIKLVIAGPFRFTRNPMYLALLLLMASAFCLSASWWMLVFSVVLFLLLDRGVITREEENMKCLFGDEFISYQAKVRRWI